MRNTRRKSWDVRIFGRSRFHLGSILTILVWDNVYGFNMKCIREIAIREPLVDVVPYEAVVTNAFPFKNIDLLTVKKEELSFTAQFDLVAKRGDYVHAFVAYFDTRFSQVPKPIKLPTGPDTKCTHWKQTVFYLEETIVVDEGEKITGTVTCKPNSRNPRDLDISISYDVQSRHGKFNGTQNYHMC